MAGPEFITSCCGRPIEHCPGCHQDMVLLRKDDIMSEEITVVGNLPGTAIMRSKPYTGVVARGDYKITEYNQRLLLSPINARNYRYIVDYNDLAKAKNEKSVIPFEKIQIESVEDLQRVIDEATPESARDRVRRRSSHRDGLIDNHQDEDGHSDLELPTFADRVQPKRERSNRTQMQHRGKLGHRHSSRTQKGKPKQFSEAIDFIREHIGKPINYELLTEVNDKRSLYLFATRLMSKPGIDRDWLFGLCDLLGSNYD